MVIDDSDSDHSPSPKKIRKENFTYKSGNRSKFKCPECYKMYVHLPVHLRNIHGYDDNSARYCSLTHGLRKVRGKNRKSVKDYHHRKKCTVPNCTAVVKRLPHHLKTYHKLLPQQLVQYILPSESATVEEEVNLNQNVSSTESEDTDTEYEMAPSVTPEEYTGEFISFDIVLKKFKIHLKSPLGRQLDDVTIRQHEHQLKVIYKTCCMLNNTTDYLRMLDTARINASFQYLRRKKVNGGLKLKNRTLRGYISSLKHLLRFFRFHSSTIDSRLATIELSKFDEELTDLSKGMKKGVLKEIWKCKDKAQLKLPSKQEINIYLKSPVRSKIINRLKSLKKDSSIALTTQEMVMMYGLFFIEISLDNANRNGEIRNMLLREFDSAEVALDRSCTIEVRKHKTYANYGKTHLFINKEIYPLLRIYRNVVRPNLDNNNTREFFITSTGQKLSSTSLSYYMQSLWKKLAFKSAVGPTLFRKTAVTALYNDASASSMKSQLATKMNHKESTASSAYFTINRKQVANNMASKLREIITNDSTPTHSVKAQMVSDKGAHLLHSSPSLHPPPSPPMHPSSSPPMHPPSSPMHLPSSSIVDTDYRPPVDADSSGAEEFEPWSAKNHFTKSEEEHLAALFHNVFLKNRIVSKDLVVRLLEKTELGKSMLKKFPLPKIKNKLNYLKHRKLAKN